jgi:hypothetical protein
MNNTEKFEGHHEGGSLFAATAAVMYLVA